MCPIGNWVNKLWGSFFKKLTFQMVTLSYIALNQVQDPFKDGTGDMPMKLALPPSPRKTKQNIKLKASSRIFVKIKQSTNAEKGAI